MQIVLKSDTRKHSCRSVALLLTLVCVYKVPEAASASTLRKNDNPKGTITLCGPTYNLARHAFSLPAAFWNEHLCNWLDVALCGRPSNFLHETVLSVETTRSIIRRAMKKIGFHAATRWAPNFNIFGQIRGQPVLILVRFPLHGRMQTFPLDELIRFNGWSRSAGPLGWLYLGTPGIYQLPKHLQDALPGQRVTPRAVLYNDPQIAMNYRGIRSQSQALLNSSMCTDNWIYPSIRFYRNPRLVPLAVFNSNGKIPAKIIFQRVSEVELLKAAIKYWHAPSIKPVANDLIPLAKKMDAWRRDLWRRVHADIKAWNTSSKVQLDAAKLRHAYAEITYQFVDWSATHSKFSATASHTLPAIKIQAQRFLTHLRDQVKATWAWVQYRNAQTQSRHPNTAAAKRRLLGATLEARCKFLLYTNLQYLRYWKLKYQKLSPKDPRHLWIAMIKAQYANAKARNQLALAGITYAKMLTAGNRSKIPHAMSVYEDAIITSHIHKLEVVELQYKFRISNDTGFVSKKHMAMLKEREKNAKAEISSLRHEIQKMKNSQAK